MNYPKYQINLFHQSYYPSGQTQVNVNGATTSINTYSGNYYVAFMPQFNLSATGSTYETALSNLLLIATSSNY